MTPDKAAAAVWTAHGLVMNGGVLHCAAGLSKREFRDAIAGYRFFGLTNVAQILEEGARVTSDGAGDAEPHLDDAYNSAIPTDEYLISEIEKAFPADQVPSSLESVGQQAIDAAVDQFVEASSEAERLSRVTGKTREQHRAHARTEAAVTLLLRYWPHGGHEALLKLLRHGDGAVRAAAATYLAVSDPEVAIPVLEQLDGARVSGSLTAFGTLFAIKHRSFPDPLVRLRSTR